MLAKSLMCSRQKDLRKHRPQLKKTTSPTQYLCKLPAQYARVQQQECWKSSRLCFSYTLDSNCHIYKRNYSQYFFFEKLVRPQKSHWKGFTVDLVISLKCTGEIPSRCSQEVKKPQRFTGKLKKIRKCWEKI